MIRRLNILGLGLAAILAMSAITASGAQAAVEFTSESPGSTRLTASSIGEQEFTIPGVGETSCESVALAASDEFSSPVTALTLHPEYPNCEAFGFPSHVEFTGCDYRFDQPSKVKADEYASTVDLVCPEGKRVDITIAALNCVIRVFSQNGIAGLTYTDKTGASPPDLEIAAKTAEVLKWEIVTDTAGSTCAETGKTGANGIYTGKVTLRGDHSGSSTGVSVSG